MYTAYDNILSTQEHQSVYHGLIKSKNWAYGHYSMLPDNFLMGEQISNFAFWNLDLTHEEFFNTYFMKKIKDLTGMDLRYNRIYANGQTYGQPGNWHIDDESGYTFLYYPNPTWNLKFGGETLFVDGTIRHYKPNSGILFPANVSHMGMEPSRHFPGLRLTVAFKLYQK